MNYVSLGICLLLLAGYMLYIARRFWILLGRVWSTSRKPPYSVAGLMCAIPVDAEAPDCALLWETQRPALEMLRASGSTGVSKARMRKLYREFARVYPELYDGSTFMDWMDALQNAAVAVHCRAADRIAITETGRSILADLERKHVFQNAPAFPGRSLANSAESSGAKQKAEYDQETEDSDESHTKLANHHDAAGRLFGWFGTRPNG